MSFYGNPTHCHFRHVFQPAKSSHNLPFACGIFSSIIEWVSRDKTKKGILKLKTHITNTYIIIHPYVPYQTIQDHNV